MKDYGIFDVVGPIMIGPSSSHTAGACRIGNMALQIFDSDVVKVDFYLHGSFAKTYKGHGTDRALLAGIMGMKTDDERIKNAYEEADKIGLKYEFIQDDLGDVHPNTVKIVMTNREGDVQEVTGSSIGGGKIIISRINSFDVEIDGEYPTLVTKHYDKPGMIAKITAVLAEEGINIAFMKVFRKTRGDYARLIIQIDDAMTEESIDHIRSIDGVCDVNFIRALKI